MNKLAEALTKSQSEMTAATKDGKNPHFRSTYATLQSTWDAVRAPLTKYGLCVIQYGEIDQRGKQLLVTRLMHSSGEFIESRLELLIQKADMPGFGSAWTYARRYALQAICGISADDDDGVASMQRPAPTPQAQPAPAKPKVAASAPFLPGAKVELRGPTFNRGTPPPKENKMPPPFDPDEQIPF